MNIIINRWHDINDFPDKAAFRNKRAMAFRNFGAYKKKQLRILLTSQDSQLLHSIFLPILDFYFQRVLV